MSQSSDSSIFILLKPVGSAPLVAEAKRAAFASTKVSELLQALKTELQVDNLLLYVNAAFALSPTDSLGELAKNFASQSYLTLNYSTIPAWG